MTFWRPENGYLHCERDGLTVVETPSWDGTALYEACYSQAAAYFSGD